MKEEVLPPAGRFVKESTCSLNTAGNCTIPTITPGRLRGSSQTITACSTCFGNVMERCHDTTSPNTASATPVIDQTTFAEVRGGEFGAAPHNLRSARRHTNVVSDEWASVGFRVARTIIP
jgi:hypothetical protein